jgi:hypothetical protein
MKIKSGENRDAKFNNSILLYSLFIVSLSLSTRNVDSQPAVLETGMTPNQQIWAYETSQENIDKQVKFFMRVQRQGNLSSYGTFDYYFKVQVLRPDGTDVWNTRYGFDENGYSEQVFSLPTFFLERSTDRSNPSFGTWKIRLVMDEKDSKKEVFIKEFNLSFTNGKGDSQTTTIMPAGSTSNPFPLVPFTYQKWTLKGWGVGIFDEVSTGSDSYDKEIKILKCNNSFTVKEVADAWSQGHKFGVWLTGPPAATYKNSNNNPLYLFGYILRRPDGEADGANPTYRQNSYCNNPGSVAFPFDLRTVGVYKIEYFLRERDKNSWEESSWIPVGGLEFTITP